MQEKLTSALGALAEERDLDLIVEREYTNTGFFSFQRRGALEPVLRFPFNFQSGYSSFASGGRPGPLGRNARGGIWSSVKGGEHDVLLIRVAEVLDEAGAAPPDGGAVNR